MNYLIDWLDIIKKNVKVELHKIRNLQLFLSTTKAVKDVNVEFDEFTNDTNYFLSFNGQKQYLERYLNDQYDPVARLVYIENTNVSSFKPIYKKAEENIPVFIYYKSEGQPATYYYRKGEPIGIVAFIVWIPDYVLFDETALRAQVDQYKQAGKKYSVQIYTP